MKFAVESWLYAALAVIPVCLALVWWGVRRRRASLARIVAPRLHEKLLKSVDLTKRNWKTALFLTALALLLATLARPQYGLREAQIERAGVDVILALDVSRSMMAEDAASNRLASAKAAITRLLDLPSRDRYGLIIFAGEAFLSAPVTQDHGAVQRTVQALSTIAVSKPGTDLAEAIKLATRSFDETVRKGKALILITDGEQLQGDAVIAAREAVVKGITVFTVGVGSSIGAKVPERQWGQVKFSKNEFGREVVSRLNENVLRQIATAGRGFYTPIGKEGDGLVAISDRGIAPLAKGTQTRQSKDMREYFQFPLGAVVLFLFCELLVSERRKGLAVPEAAPPRSPRSRRISSPTQGSLIQSN